MSEPHPQETDKANDGITNLKRFMIARGVLTRRDQHLVGSIKTEYGNKLSLNTLIFSVGNSTNVKKTYGTILSIDDSDGNTEGTDNIDYDELDELINAMVFMQDYAKQLFNETTEYTEVQYATKEGTSVGFYQNRSTQQGFIKTDQNAHAFLSVNKLSEVNDLFIKARDYLKQLGANE